QPWLQICCVPIRRKPRKLRQSSPTCCKAPTCAPDSRGLPAAADGFSQSLESVPDQKPISAWHTDLRPRPAPPPEHPAKLVRCPKAPRLATALGQEHSRHAAGHSQPS